MRILVIGAGVLGSYLAHELCEGPDEISILARGQRYDDLIEYGLVVEHIRQKKRTINKLRVTNKIAPVDIYDITFIVMQKHQINEFLPDISTHLNSKIIVFMGNNCLAESTEDIYNKESQQKSSVLFGFLGCAGHRNGYIVHNWHDDNCTVSIGSLRPDSMATNAVNVALSKTNLKLDVKKDISAWLKYHCAIITPICLAIQYEGGANVQDLKKSKALTLSIESYKEAIQFFEKQGLYNEPPHNKKLLHLPTGILRFFLAHFLPTKTGHYIAVSHALSATEEIDVLTKELLLCAAQNESTLESLEKLNDMVTGSSK